MTTALRTMTTAAALALAATPLLAQPATPATPAAGDTLRLEVGSPEVDGRVYAPHAARVRVRLGTPDGRRTAEWTNELTHGDSAGRPVHRWITRGTQYPATGDSLTWEIHQTYDARTLAPYGYLRRASTGAETRLTIDGRRVRGTRRIHRDSAAQPVDVELDRPGFVASASDLVPAAVGLREGLVMAAPMWAPNMARTELRVFTVLGEVPVDVEGTEVRAWKIEERRHADRTLLATWYMTRASPYMVYGEVVLPNGQVQYMSEVEVRR